MYQIIPPKHYIRNLIILGIALGLPIVLVVGLIAHVSLFDLFIMGLMTIAIGFVLGGLIGWLFLKFVYPQLRSNGEKSAGSLNVQANMMEKMYAEYELNSDDVLSFYSYNYEQSPTLRRAWKLIRRTLLFAVVVELFASVILGVAFGNQYLILIVVLCVFALLTLLYYVFSASLMRKGLKGKVARNYDRGKDKLTGKHKLSISPDAVIDITDIGESITRWNAIEWIAYTDQYLFMTVRDSVPHIVPRRAFADEAAFNQFVEAAKAYHQAQYQSAT